MNKLQDTQKVEEIVEDYKEKKKILEGMGYTFDGSFVKNIDNHIVSEKTDTYEQIDEAIVAYRLDVRSGSDEDELLFDILQYFQHIHYESRNRVYENILMRLKQKFSGVYFPFITHITLYDRYSEEEVYNTSMTFSEWVRVYSK